MKHATPLMLTRRPIARQLRLIGWAALSVALSACGGGGGNPGSPGGSGGGSGTGTGGVVVSTEPAMKVALADSGGIAVTSLSGGQVATVRATFTDAAGAPAAGAKVTFAVDPLLVFDPLGTTTATTDANGVATIRVKPASISSEGSATITASGEVAAGASKGKTASVSINLPVKAQATALADSAGLPIQRSLSLSVDVFNLEGWRWDGSEASITVRLADQYSNKVPDGTVVNVLAEGGAIGTPLHRGCVTTDGSCTVKFVTQEFRPSNGRVTVMAYVEGVENFVDTNGDGRYSCANYVDAKGAVPPIYRPLIDTCVSGGEPFDDQGDPFVDAGLLGSMAGSSRLHSLDFTYHAGSDIAVPYKRSTFSAAGDGKWGLNYISDYAELTFSDGTAELTRLKCSTNAVTGQRDCRDWNESLDGVNQLAIRGLEGTCAPQTIDFRLHDLNNNPLPYKTKLTLVDASGLQPLAFTSDEVESTNRIGGTRHQLTVRPAAGCAAGSFGVKVESPVLKKTKVFTFISAS